ncbi:unnamed protein product [Oikopleura dioica]|uniref:Uncharacterized protein n=1 Tax=Oikopleura dioica TaxID=34765 RepID=E4YWM7_OIKDI|nr:unnamed protein product [Oikopleura dioica]
MDVDNEKVANSTAEVSQTSDSRVPIMSTYCQHRNKEGLRKLNITLGMRTIEF